jgi:hypothetical protein
MNVKKRLNQVAQVFVGAGSLDLFSRRRLEKAKSASGPLRSCLVINALDVASRAPWKDPESIVEGVVRGRYIDTPVKGTGISPALQPGDILVTTRGRLTVSPMVTREMLSELPLVAGPELLVVRTKGETHPALILHALRRREAREFLLAHARRKNAGKSGTGLDRSAVLGKKVLLTLPFPEGLEKLVYRFGDKLENEAYSAEASLQRLQALNHAIVEAAKWRAETRHDTTRPRFSPSEVAMFSWEKQAKLEEAELRKAEHAGLDQQQAEWLKDLSKPFPKDPHARARREAWDRLYAACKHRAAQGLARALRDIADGRLESEDARVLLQLLEAGTDIGMVRAKLLESEEASLATLELAHRGHGRDSGGNVGRTIHRLLAACAGGVEKVCVLEAETGHLALEVIRTCQSVETLRLIEDDADYRMVAQALCKFAKPGLAVESDGQLGASNAAARSEIALMDVSCSELDKKSNLEETSKRLLGWQGWDTCPLIVHVPTSHWELLRSRQNNISAILQLPPLLLPAESEGRLEGSYAPCDQGIIAVIEPHAEGGRLVKVLDATMLTDGKAVAELDEQTIARLAAALKTGEPCEGCAWNEIRPERLFSEAGSPWPSLLTLLGRKPPIEGEPVNCTLETLLEDLIYHDFARKRSQRRLLDKIGVRLSLAD